MDTRTTRTNALVPVRHIRIVRHLALSLQGAIYAVALLNVRDIIDRARHAGLRRANDGRRMLGMINLRGFVAPLIDLPRHFVVELAMINKRSVATVLVFSDLCTAS